MKKSNVPKQIKPINADEAWVYVNKKSIEVCIYAKGSPTLTARITRQQILSWLAPKD